MTKCSNDGLMGGAVTGKPVTECQDLSEVFRASLPAFGGAYLRRVYDALHAVIETLLDHSAHQGCEHCVHHGDGRDLLSRRPRLSAQDLGAADSRGGYVGRRRRAA